jgi:hypothetical protein
LPIGLFETVCQKREGRLTELKTMLFSENTEEKLQLMKQNEARKIPRQEFLEKVQRQNSSQGKVTFVIKYDPRLPQI